MNADESLVQKHFNVTGRDSFLPAVVVTALLFPPYAHHAFITA